MSELTEQLIARCEAMTRRMDAGEPLTPEDLAHTASLSYRFGLADGRKAGGRDRLAEIWADMHTRLDAGLEATSDEMRFAEILEERTDWVDMLHEIQTHLEERP